MDECGTAEPPAAADPTASMPITNKRVRGSTSPARTTDESRPKKRVAHRATTTTGWQSNSSKVHLPPMRPSAQVVTPPSAPKSSSTPTSPRPVQKKAAGKEPRSQHARQQQKRPHLQQVRNVSPNTPPVSAAPVHAKDTPPTTPSPPCPAPQANAVAPTTLAAVPPMIPSGEITTATTGVASVSRCMPVVDAAPSEPSVDGSSSGWDDVPGIFVASPEDEVIWSADDFSDDDLVVEAGSIHFRGDGYSGLPQLGGLTERTTPARGVFGGAWPGNAQPQRHQLQQWPQARPSSPSVVSSHRYAASLENKALVLGGGGGGGGGRGVGFTARIRSQEGLRNERTVAGSARDISSPILTWTQEAVEAGASTLLAVLADTELGPPSSGGAGCGARGEGWEHLADKRPFACGQLPCTTSSGFTPCTGIATNGMPTQPPALTTVGPRHWHGTAASHPRGSSFCDANTSSSADTMSLDGTSWMWGATKAAPRRFLKTNRERGGSLI